MTTMQQKLTAQFKAVVTDFKNDDLEFIEAPGIAANVGAWHVMDGLDTLVKIGYNFQANYVTIDIAGRLAQHEPAELDRHWCKRAAQREFSYFYPHIFYGQGDEIRVVLGTVRGLLSSWRAERLKDAGAEPEPEPEIHAHTVDGPAYCHRCQFLRDNAYWMDLPTKGVTDG